MVVTLIQLPFRVKFLLHRAIGLARNNEQEFPNRTMETNPIKHLREYNQDDASGFIRHNALRLKVAAKVQRKKLN